MTDHERDRLHDVREVDPRQRRPAHGLRDDLHRVRRAGRPDDHHREVRPVFIHAEVPGAPREDTRAEVLATVEPRDPILRVRVKEREAATDDDLAIGWLQQHRVDQIVRAEPEVDRRIDGAVRAAEPHDVIAGKAVVAGEVADRDHIAIGLDVNAGDVIVGTGADVERVERAVWIEPREEVAGRGTVGGEQTADEDFAVGLNANRAHRTVEVRAGVEGRIDGPIRQQAHQVTAAGTRETGEVTPEVNRLAGRMNRNRMHRRARARAEAERRVHRATRGQARDEVLIAAVDGREPAADHDLAIRLQRQRVDDAVRADGGGKREVQRAVGEHPREVAAERGTDRVELARKQNRAVGLHRHRAQRTAATEVIERARHKRRIKAATREQPRRADTIHPVELGEITGDHHAGTGVERERVDRPVRAGARDEARVH